MNIKNDILRRLLAELKKALKKLSDISTISKKEFLKNYEKVDTAKYNFIVAIEAMIDICNHIISEENLGMPEDYADVFRIMGEAGIFKKDFVEKLEDMAKFRNLLVHIYWKVDEEKIYKFIKEDLRDFVIFENSIRKHLKKK